jgi:acyl dehydratase
MMRIFKDVDDLKASLGEQVGYSSWVEVGQPRIDAFADATGDHQWIHVDPARAASGPYGSTIAHGYLTLALVPRLVGEVYRLDGMSMLVNYGLNRLRFPAPVPVGSRVRGGVELLTLEPSAGGYQLATQVTVEIDGSNKPACVADTLTLVVP